jgi:hypothetical protein
MKVGILSDTHGNLRALGAALEIFSAKGMEVIVHCGDVGAAKCIRVVGTCGLPAYVVAGNMDRRVDRLAETAAAWGVNFSDEVIKVPLAGGAYMAVTHGHDPAILNGLIDGGQFPYVCHGHTHRPGDQRIGNVRVINPGALERAGMRTFAALDTERDILERFTLNL